MPGKAPERTEVVYVRMPVDLKLQLRQLADRRHGGNLSEAVRFLLAEYTARERQAMALRGEI